MSDELEPVSNEWTEPATEEELEAWQSADSGDYFDEDYGDDDDWDSDEWPEQSLSTWVRIHEDGHISYFQGILSRYKGEDWGEASGWEEHEYQLDQVRPEFKARVLAFAKDRAPGDYDTPFDMPDDDEEEEERPIEDESDPRPDLPDEPPF